jgi:hypothetical protein
MPDGCVYYSYIGARLNRGGLKCRIGAPRSLTVLISSLCGCATFLYALNYNYLPNVLASLSELTCIFLASTSLYLLAKYKKWKPWFIFIGADEIIINISMHNNGVKAIGIPISHFKAARVIIENTTILSGAGENSDLITLSTTFLQLEAKYSLSEIAKRIFETGSRQGGGAIRALINIDQCKMRILWKSREMQIVPDIRCVTSLLSNNILIHPDEILNV